MKIFRTLCITSSVILIYSFIQLLFLSNSFIADLGLESTQATLFLARRASAFSLSAAVFLFLVRNISIVEIRLKVSFSVGFLMFIYAGIGVFEWLIDSVNTLVFVPVILEFLLGTAFFVIFGLELRAKRKVGAGS